MSILKNQVETINLSILNEVETIFLQIHLNIMEK